MTKKATTGGFGLEGETRMPAATMGSRARRTSQLIQEKAREVFLVRGYVGTNVEDIADAAGVSRASFYTYFPTKRDVLLKIGQHAHEATELAFDDMMAMAGDGTATVTDIVAKYLEVLDEHGAFAEVWRQAAFDDVELREAGLRAQLKSAKRFAEILVKLGWSPGADANRVALAFMLMMDRYWFHSQVMSMRGSRADMVDTLASIIAATVEGRPR